MWYNEHNFYERTATMLICYNINVNTPDMHDVNTINWYTPGLYCCTQIPKMPVE